MAEPVWRTLQRAIEDRYDILKARLARRFGSEELAAECLNEAWLKFSRQPDIEAVDNVEAYIFRTSLNMALNVNRSEIRQLSGVRIIETLQADRDLLDPERVWLARSQMSELAQALEELPPRRREIFIAARIEELSSAEVAIRFGISRRFVNREIAAAFAYFDTRLQKKLSEHNDENEPESVLSSKKDAKQ